MCAPALPGFAGTHDLPSRDFTLGGYGRWLDAFLRVVGVDEKVVVVGHSFGGGVAIRFAHDHPDAVRSLVLVELDRRLGVAAGPAADLDRRAAAVGLGPALPRRHLPDRPGHPGAARDPAGRRAEPDAQPSLDVCGWRTWPARADLRSELEELKRRGTPVTVLWAKRDGIIPKESFEAMCVAVGAEGRVIDGSHSWLLADPDAFGEVITNDLEVAKLARELEAAGPPRRRLFRRRPKARELPSLTDAGSARRRATAASSRPVSILRRHPPLRFGWLLLAALDNRCFRRRPPHCGGHSADSLSVRALGRRGPAMRRSPRRRVTPRASSSLASGSACLRVVPMASRKLGHREAVGLRGEQRRRRRRRRRRWPRARTRRRRARPPARGGPARAARPGRRRRGRGARSRRPRGRRGTGGRPGGRRRRPAPARPCATPRRRARAGGRPARARRAWRRRARAVRPRPPRSPSDAVIASTAPGATTHGPGSGARRSPVSTASSSAWIQPRSAITRVDRAVGPGLRRRQHRARRRAPRRRRPSRRARSPAARSGRRAGAGAASAGAAARDPRRPGRSRSPAEDPHARPGCSPEPM